MKLFFLPSALFDLENIFDFIHERSGDPEMAKVFVRQLVERMGILIHFPNLGYESPDARWRCLVLADYGIFYEITNSQKITIYHVRHFRSDPFNHLP